MSKTLHRRSILRKTAEVGWATLASRLLGLVRETILGRYLGATAFADIFITAYKIPNSLRKIFAEGALSAAFIPVLVKLSHEKEGKDSVNSLMSASFLIFEGALILFCLWIFWRADVVIRIIVPGWYSYQLPPAPGGFGAFFSHIIHWLTMLLSPQTYNMQPGPQVAYAITYLRILISFIIFISSSALLSGALQSVNHFFIPAFSPVLLNVVFIVGAGIAWSYGLPVEYLCFFVLFGGLLQFILHVITYFSLGFNFGPLNSQAWKNVRFVLKKFFPCVMSMSVMEINLFIDTSLASYLPSGSMMIIYLANRFMGIPLGVFAVAFSTILLPHFSRISMQAPKRLSFYLFESAKLIFWVTVPVTLIMILWSQKIFYTLFLSERFPLAKVIEGSHVLIAFILGLFFFSLNKILLNVYYALHETRIPAIITLIATISNLTFNLMWLEYFQATGLAFATTVSLGLVQTGCLLFFLKTKYKFQFYGDKFFSFVIRYLTQLISIGLPAYIIYRVLGWFIELLPNIFSHFLINQIGFWLWTMPLAGLMMLALYMTRQLFGVRLYFLD